MTKLKLSTITAVALFSIIGCGSSSGNNDGNGANNAKTGTGYYVDSAVAGVEYVCGSQTGKTGSDGKFTFEEGKECKFTLAGVPLRTAKADELADGKKIVEDNPKVAKLLQSIDADGDLSNGIQVTDEVVEALTKALDETQSTGKLPEGDTLTEVVANVGHDVTGVSGEVRTDEEVHAHLTQTQTEITKELLAGKTFYLPYNDDGVDIIDKIVVNSTATSITWEEVYGGSESGTDSVQINGSSFTTTSNGESNTHEILSVTNSYIKIKDSEDNHIHKLYFTLTDAKATLNAESGGGTPSQPTPNSLSASSLKAYFSGKTLYMVDTEDASKIAPVIFNADATTLQVGTYGTPWAITIEDGKIVDEEGNHFIDEITDKHIKGHDSYGEFIFYVNRADAQAFLDAEGGESDNTLAITQDMLNGKIFYLSHDEEDDTKAYVKATVQTNSQISFHEIRLKKSDNTETMNLTNSVNYTLANGILILDLEDDGSMSFELKSKDNSKWDFFVTEQDGTKFNDSWYFSKPANYPSAL